LTGFTPALAGFGRRFAVAAAVVFGGRLLLLRGRRPSRIFRRRRQLDAPRDLLGADRILGQQPDRDLETRFAWFLRLTGKRQRRD